MAILVFAEPQAEFEAWRQQQLDAGADAGRAGAAAQACRSFSAIPAPPATPSPAPTPADRLGPDLTHFGGRATIAAGLLHNTPRESRPLAGRSAGGEAGRQHAEGAAVADRTRRAGRLSGGPEVSEARAGMRDTGLDAARNWKRGSPRSGARPPGLWGWLTTVDHKAIGRRYVVTALIFLFLGGLVGAGDAAAARRAGEQAGRARTSTTSFSPCTARP